MTKEQFDELKKMAEQWNKTKAASCPSCGYCPHCGRGGHQMVPYYPTYPIYPQPYPWQPYITWSGTTTVITGGHA